MALLHCSSLCKLLHVLLPLLVLFCYSSAALAGACLLKLLLLLLMPF
jgi:hypothetical protein